MGQTRYPSKTASLSKSNFQRGQQQLYHLPYKVSWILYKMVGFSSFSQPYSCIQQLLQSPPKTLSSTSGNFYLPIPPLLFNKIILTIPTNTPFLYAAAIFHLTVFAYNHPGYLHQPYFSYLIYLANSDCVKGKRSYGVLISSFFPKVWTVESGSTVDSLLFRLRKLVYCR